MEVMKDKKTQVAVSQAIAGQEPIKSTVGSTAAALSSLKPSLPPEVAELYLTVRLQVSSPANLTYHPAIAAFGQVAIFDNRLGISQVSEVANYIELTDEVMGLLWDKSLPLPYKVEALKREPETGASFVSLPSRSLSLLKSAGATIFGAILGRKSYHLGRATTTARSASQAYYEKMDIKRAQEQVELTRVRLEEMERGLQVETDNLASLFDPAGEQLETMALRPKKKT